MSTLIMKFGGTSVGSADAIRCAAEIVRAAQAAWPRVVVVASAMSGVTDALLKGAHTAADGDANTFRSIAQDLRAKHFTALNELIKQPEQSSVARATVEVYLNEFESLCHAVNVLGEASPRALDAISSLGERMSIQLIAAYLKSIGMEAEPIESSELVVTDTHFQAANPIADDAAVNNTCRRNPHACLVMIAPGFGSSVIPVWS